MKTLHILAKGRVQGVCYRAFTETEANKLGLSGWVKNLSNGNVELEVTGDSKHLDEFVKKLSKGPTMARVDELEIDEIELQYWENFQTVY